MRFFFSSDKNQNSNHQFEERNHAQEFKPSVKFKIVLEAIKTDKAVAEVARNFDVHPNTVRNWIETFEENGQEVFSEDGEVKELEENVAELERLVGQKEREIAILKNFLGNLD